MPNGFDEINVLDVDGVRVLEGDNPAASIGHNLRVDDTGVFHSTRGFIEYSIQNLNHALELNSKVSVDSSVGFSGVIYSIPDIDNDKIPDYLIPDTTAGNIYALQGPLYGNYTLPQDSILNIAGPANSRIGENVLGIKKVGNISSFYLTAPFNNNIHDLVYEVDFSSNFSLASVLQFDISQPPSAVTVNTLNSTEPRIGFGEVMFEIPDSSLGRARAITSPEFSSQSLTQNGKVDLFDDSNSIITSFYGTESGEHFGETGTFLGEDNNDVFFGIGSPDYQQQRGRLSIYKNYSPEPFQTILGEQQGSKYSSSLAGNFRYRDNSLGLAVSASGDDRVYIYSFNGSHFNPQESYSYEGDPLSNFGESLAAFSESDHSTLYISDTRNPGRIFSVPFNKLFIRSGLPLVTYEDERVSLGNSINLISDQNSVSINIVPNPLAIYNISVSEVYQDQLHYLYDVRDGSYYSNPPSSADEVNRLLAQTNFDLIEDYNGETKLRFTATDGYNPSSTREVSIQVIPVPDEPRVQPVEQQAVSLNEDYTFSNFTITNPDGNLTDIAYSYINQPVWLNIERRNDLPYFSGNPTQLGNYTFSITATNTVSGLSTNIPFPLQVVEPGAYPTREGVIPDQSITIQQPPIELDLSQYFSHPYFPQNLTFSEVDFPRDDITLSEDGMLTMPHQADKNGWGRTMWRLGLDLSYDAEQIEFSVCAPGNFCLSDNITLNTSQQDRDSTQERVFETIVYGIPTALVTSAALFVLKKCIWPKIEDKPVGRKIKSLKCWDKDEEDPEDPKDPNAQSNSAGQPSQPVNQVVANNPQLGSAPVQPQQLIGQRPSQGNPPNNPSTVSNQQTDAKQQKFKNAKFDKNTVNTFAKVFVKELGLSDQTHFSDLYDLIRGLSNREILIPIAKDLAPAKAMFSEKNKKHISQLQTGLKTAASFFNESRRYQEMAQREKGWWKSHAQDLSLQRATEGSALQYAQIPVFLASQRLAQLKDFVRALSVREDDLSLNDIKSLYLLAYILAKATKNVVKDISLASIKENQVNINQAFFAYCDQVACMPSDEYKAFQYELFEHVIQLELQSGVKYPGSDISSVKLVGDSLRSFSQEVLKDIDLLRTPMSGIVASAVQAAYVIADGIDHGLIDAEKTSWLSGEYRLKLESISTTSIQERMQDIQGYAVSANSDFESLVAKAEEIVEAEQDKMKQEIKTAFRDSLIVLENTEVERNLINKSRSGVMIFDERRPEKKIIMESEQISAFLMS